MTPNLKFRDLTPGDVPLLLEFTGQESWGFDRADADRMLRLGGGLVAEGGGGTVLGLLTLLHYNKLAWIGNVVVRPPARGAGIGGALVEAAVTTARNRGAETVGLYSVLPAVSLYERAAFRNYAEVVSLVGEGGLETEVHGVAPLRARRIPELARFDERFSGDDRTRLLTALHDAFPDSVLVHERGGRIRGYVVAKPGEQSSEIGPLVAEPGDMGAVATLVDAALTRLTGPVEAAVPSMNLAATRQFAARGFKRAFAARAMYRGAAGHEADHFAVGAVAGLEKG